ncbi:MAG: hypothetical protein HZA22_13395 [Nitrospirae bacterium]|nr:hypothetical protein [Nitrospirota bacterium]MBI5694641.1 hypothetical protein [Nitrospirota bacterium]
MRCPFLMSYERDMCVSDEMSIIPSGKHRENFCETGSHWACPMKKSFSTIADEFSYAL